MAWDINPPALPVSGGGGLRPGRFGLGGGTGHRRAHSLG